MGVMLAFVLGWAVGTKAGPGKFEELAEAARTVKQSEEFSALVVLARSQLAHALEGLGRLISGEEALPDPGDVLLQVQRLGSHRRG